MEMRLASINERSQFGHPEMGTIVDPHGSQTRTALSDTHPYYA